MSRHVTRRTHLLIPLFLALAACQDATAPRTDSQLSGLHPRFTQGDGSIWTVNSLADPGTGTCDDAECTLREAILAAGNGNIVFESGLQGDIDLTAGSLNIVQKNLTIDGGGRIAIDAQGNSRGIFVAGIIQPPVVTLARLTVKNGSSTESGGGIFVGTATLTLDSVTVSNSGAETGGGVGAVVSTVTILNSTITGNGANAGGGIYLDNSTMTLNNTTVAGNNASNGGGIYNNSTLNMNNSSVAANSASFDGGGVYNNGALTMTASTISLNQTFLRGGGIFNASGRVATLTRSTISSNRSTFNDVPDEFGDGIHSLGTVNLRSTTVALNGEFGLVSGTFNLTNSIVQGSCRASIVSLGHNLADFCLSAGPTDLIVAASQMFTEVIDPQLKDNGGPTKTHALILRGRAVDVGYCPGETADQRGFTRPVDDPVMANAVDACDIGAYEIQGPFIATSDLMVSQTVDKTSVKQGDLLTYYVRVQNLGPQTAPNVILNDVLSSGVTFYSARSNKGTFTAPPRGENGTVTWRVGDMLSQANEVAEIAVTVLVKGNTTITNTATATANVVDPNTANNSSAITVSVVLSGGKTGGGGTGGGGGGGGGGNPHR